MCCPRMNSAFCMRNWNPIFVCFMGVTCYKVCFVTWAIPHTFLSAALQSCCATSLLVPDRVSCIYKGQNWWWSRDLRQRLCLWGFVAWHTKWCHCVLWGICCIFEGLGLSYIWDMGISQMMNLCQSSLVAFAAFLCGIKNPNCCASAVLIITEGGKVCVIQMGIMDAYWFGF